MPKTADEIFTRLLEELLFSEVVLPVRREAKQYSSACPICLSQCRSFTRKPGLDIYGNKPDPNCQKTYECPNCRRKFPAMRYAQHLEKCLGISTRSRRANTSANSYLRDRLVATGSLASGQSAQREDFGDDDQMMDDESNSSDTSYRQRGRGVRRGQRGRQKRKTGEMITGMNLDQFTNFDRRTITTPDMAPQHRDPADNYGPE